MNKQSKSLGKRSTNTASLSNAISSIKSSISPIIKTSRTTGHPKPLKANGEMWLPRTSRIFLNQATSAEEVSLTRAAIFANAQITGMIRVLGLKVWNYSNPGNTTNYIGVETQGSLTETAVTTGVNDVGSSDHLPGVSIRIPRTIASDLVTSTGPVCTIRTTPSGSPSVAQAIVIDVHFEYKTDINA